MQNSFNDIVNIYVVTHKQFDCVPSERTVIGVGDNRNIDVADIYDNVGDNIADKNRSFCELTALYWIWKNDTSDVVGLEHYRRFFLADDRTVSIEKAKNILETSDIIVPYKIYYDRSVYDHYKKFHIISDLDETEKIIAEKYPAYTKAFHKMKTSNSMRICNMFIGKKAIADDYCEWLFSILFELEKRIDISDRDDYQKRVFGFLAERLFNVYLLANPSIKIHETSITSMSKYRLRSRLMMKCRYFKNKIFKKDDK